MNSIKKVIALAAISVSSFTAINASAQQGNEVLENSLYIQPADNGIVRMKFVNAETVDQAFNNAETQNSNYNLDTLSGSTGIVYKLEDGTQPKVSPLPVKVQSSVYLGLKSDFPDNYEVDLRVSNLSKDSGKVLPMCSNTECNEPYLHIVSEKAKQSNSPDYKSKNYTVGGVIENFDYKPSSLSSMNIDGNTNSFNLISIKNGPYAEHYKKLNFEYTIPANSDPGFYSSTVEATLIIYPDIPPPLPM